ncbi:TPA: aspartyl beta-hydroxylase, partial [Pseudomonas aeruginosa]|nr:aspartyl beta-hydroxylase [Pseudomonas aeruginosa]
MVQGSPDITLVEQVNHSAWFAPYNSLMYLFSSVPSKPYLDRSRFPELDELKNNWQTIR